MQSSVPVSFSSEDVSTDGLSNRLQRPLHEWEVGNEVLNISSESNIWFDRSDVFRTHHSTIPSTISRSDLVNSMNDENGAHEDEVTATINDGVESSGSRPSSTSSASESGMYVVNLRPRDVMEEPRTDSYSNASPNQNTSESRFDETVLLNDNMENEVGDYFLSDKNSPPKIVTTRTAPLQLPTNTRLNILVKNWTVAASWKWVARDETCGICRMPFEACCVSCKTPGDECPLAEGTCQHAFHMHCIAKWTETQSAARPQCPLCRQEWKFSSG